MSKDTGVLEYSAIKSPLIEKNGDNICDYIIPIICKRGKDIDISPCNIIITWSII